MLLITSARPISPRACGWHQFQSHPIHAGGHPRSGRPEKIGDAPRVQSPTTEEVLRRHVRSHNLGVVAASGAALVFSAVAWTALYGVTYWATMFYLTVRQAGDARLPDGFHVVCAVVAGTIMALAWLDAWLFPNDMPVDERPLLETIADVVYFLPRITLSVVQNFAAWARLRRRDRAAAVSLVDMLRDREKVPVQSLPTLIPDERSRLRILDALLVMGITHTRNEHGLTLLCLSPLAPPALRLVADDAHDHLAHMRRATVLEKKNALPCAERQPTLRDRD